jgi:hypothetical protein
MSLDELLRLWSISLALKIDKEIMEMHDSGERQEFETGAQRDTAADKPRIDLISPVFLERLGDWLRLGAEKYAERNWEQGMPLSRFIASLHRHLNAIQQGDTSEDHEAAVAFNIMGFMHTKEMIRRGLLPIELDDMPVYEMFGGENYDGIPI